MTSHRVAFAVLLATGCHHAKHGGVGDGGGVPGDGSLTDGAPSLDLPQPGALTITIRDFKFWDASDPNTNPDFENATGDDPGIVTDTLGADHKPVYKNGSGSTSTTHGEIYFSEWYNDTPNVNLHVDYPILLTMQSDGSYAYSNNTFFPIDDGTPYATAFGNQGKPHNYSFTAESHNTFVYNGGEMLSYTGDDDVFVYIDGKLAINLGGVHNAESASVSLDTLGLTKGQSYPLDWFFAERHTVSSDVLFTTTLALQPVTIQ